MTLLLYKEREWSDIINSTIWNGPIFMLLA